MLARPWSRSGCLSLWVAPLEGEEEEEEEGPAYACYPAVAIGWARKRGGLSVTPPHRLTDLHLPSGAPWVEGPPLCHQL